MHRIRESIERSGLGDSQPRTFTAHHRWEVSATARGSSDSACQQQACKALCQLLPLLMQQRQLIASKPEIRWVAPLLRSPIRRGPMHSPLEGHVHVWKACEMRSEYPAVCLPFTGSMHSAWLTGMSLSRCCACPPTPRRQGRPSSAW